MPEQPDVVGAAEAAEMLSVVPPQVTRWRKAGRMPPPVAELAATTVWLREDVQRLADVRGHVATAIEWLPREVLPLVGTSEAAHLLEKDKSQIGRWRRAGTFPEPCAELRAGPLWWRQDVVNFAAARTAA